MSYAKRCLEHADDLPYDDLIALQDKHAKIRDEARRDYIDEAAQLVVEWFIDRHATECNGTYYYDNIKSAEEIIRSGWVESWRGKKPAFFNQIVKAALLNIQISYTADPYSQYDDSADIDKYLETSEFATLDEQFESGGYTGA
jgi:hypothetical protein